MKLNLRDLFWLIVIISLAVGWWVEGRRLRKEHDRIATAIPDDLIEAASLARKNAVLKDPVVMINQRSKDLISVHISRAGDTDGGGEWFKMKRADGKWQSRSRR